MFSDNLLTKLSGMSRREGESRDGDLSYAEAAQRDNTLRAYLSEVIEAESKSARSSETENWFLSIIAFVTKHRNGKKVRWKETMILRDTSTGKARYFGLNLNSSRHRLDRVAEEIFGNTIPDDVQPYDYLMQRLSESAQIQKGTQGNPGRSRRRRIQNEREKEVAKQKLKDFKSRKR